MDVITNLINQIDAWVWGWWMILLLLGTHIFMTIRTGVIQRKIGTAIKLSVTKDPDGEGEVSQFGALTTALASTIGTGNIIGVGTAIALGGPGAVLWCWLTGVFGIATKYSESLIAVKYRVKTKDGRMQGGAMYALERGLHMKWLGLIFAIFWRLCIFWNRLCDAGECNCNGLSGKSSHSSGSGRNCSSCTDCIGYFRRNQSNCKCL